MGRKNNRRRRRKKNNRHGGGTSSNNGSFTPKLEQMMADHRRKKQDDDEMHITRTEMLERIGKEMEANQEQRDVFVRNIRYTVSAKQMKTVLEQRYGQVDKVKLFPGTSPGVSKGCGVVLFHSSKDAVNAVHDPNPPSFEGRTIQIKMNNPKKGQRRPSDNITLTLVSLEIGELVMTDQHWLRAWSPSEEEIVTKSAITKEFAVDGAKRKLYCTFDIDGTQYELQIYMKEVVGYIPIQDDGDGLVSLFVTVWKCPKIFRIENEEEMMPEIRIIWEMLADFLDYSREREPKKYRTTDPTHHRGCFGSYFTYRLKLYRSDYNLSRVVSLLSHYQLTEVPYRLRCGLNHRLANSEEHWRVNVESVSWKNNLPFLVQYELEVLSTSHRNKMDHFDPAFFKRVQYYISLYGQDVVVLMLRHMTETLYKDSKKRYSSQNYIEVLDDLCQQNVLLSSSRQNVKLEQESDDGEACYVLRVAVTPLRTVVLPQEREVKNRILRSIPRDKLLRLQFTDENLSLLNYQSLSEDIQKRIRDVLDDGIFVGGKTFEFLAFSSSQLKDHSCWMISEDLNADAVRKSMGDFSAIKIPGKYAARMGQCFSTTHVGTKEALARHEWRHIPDVERNGFTFSDGVGTISEALLHEIARRRGLSRVPSAIQVRFGGVKGVLCHDPTLGGANGSRLVCTRPSQEKFEAPSTSMDLEVCSVAQFLPCFLNRQLITLLSTLGVRNEVFIQLQEDMLWQFRMAENDMGIALQMLRETGSNELGQEMLEAEMDAAREPFLRMLLQSFKAHRLQELRMKSRIYVPKGCLLMGVMDETNTLEYGQIFCQIQRKCDVAPTMVSGRVIVAKNPCLHPGDPLQLNAVDVPQLRHLVNVVVFPQKGSRPHPDESAGSDLDGDLYSVIWDESLIPHQRHEPMNYTDPSPAPLHHGEVTMSDVKEFFVKFIVNDNLGVIANAHLALADQSPEGARDPRCLALAELHSKAVDFPKTGVPAELPREFLVKKYPNFMEKKDKESYESEKVIGHLYQTIKELMNSSSSSTALVDPKLTPSHYNPILGNFFYTDDSDTNNDMLMDAYRGREMYNQELISIMNRFGIKSEAETINGFVLKFTRRYAKTKRKHDIMERLRTSVKYLQSKAKAYFDEVVASYTGEDDDGFYDNDDGNPFQLTQEEKDIIKMEVASAFYHVTYHPNAGNKLGLLSFPWISCSAYLCQIFTSYSDTN